MKLLKKIIVILALGLLPLLAVYHLQRSGDPHKVTNLTPPPENLSSETITPSQSTLNLQPTPSDGHDNVINPLASPHSNQSWRKMIENVAPGNHSETGFPSMTQASPLTPGNQIAENAPAHLLPDFFKAKKDPSDRPKLSGKLLMNKDDEIVGAKVSVSLPTHH